VPIVTSPDGHEDRMSGLGDVVVFDELLYDGGWYEVGAGPQVTAPSATDDRLGTGKWRNSGPPIDRRSRSAATTPVSR